MPRSVKTPQLNKNHLVQKADADSRLARIKNTPAWAGTPPKKSILVQQKGGGGRPIIDENGVSLGSKPRNRLDVSGQEFAELLARGYSAASSWEYVFRHKARDLDKETIRVRGKELARNPQIQARVKELIEMATTKAQVNVDRVLQEMARIAFFDARKLFDATGAPLDITALDDDTAAVIVGCDVVTVGNADMGVGQVRKIKLADKGKGLEMLARHLAMFKDVLEVKVDAVEELRAFLGEVSRLPISSASAAVKPAGDGTDEIDTANSLLK